MNLSNELIEAIVKECTENNNGFAQIIAEDFTILIVANSEMTPDQAAILAAHSLLDGVIQSAWQEAEAKKNQELIGKRNLESVN